MNNKKIDTFLISIACIESITVVLGFIIGSSFYACLKPFIYVCIAIFSFLFMDKKYIVKYKKNYVNQIAIMTIIAYMGLYILSGIIFGFANNPLVMKGKFFFLNIIYYIPTAISIEFIRYRIVSLIENEKKFKYIIILNIILAFSMSNLSLAMFSSINSIVEMFYQVLVTNFVIGYFLSYIALNGSFYVNIIYVLVPLFYQLFAKIIPNPQWIVIVLLKTLLPIISYTLLDKFKFGVKKEDKHFEKDRSNLGYIGIGIIVFVVLFACGIFRIYPVAIASNSMKPTFSRGDIQIIDKKKETYKVGDVIQFYGLNDTTFVHRVVSVRKKDGNFYYTTKGDNNDVVDLMEISQSRIIGKSIFTIKYLGYPTLWITENL